MNGITQLLGQLYPWRRACTAFVLCVSAIALPAQTFTTLSSFDGTNGAQPYAGLIQAANGDFYGTTTSGGSGKSGTVFKVTPTGTLTTFHTFCSTTGCPDGANPYSGLVQGSSGNFFGTTLDGGPNGFGIVYQITTKGTESMLYGFCSLTGCTDGGFPYAGLVLSSSGNLYGTTEFGGTHGGGTVFEITPTGTLTTLHDFCSESGCSDGESPYSGLVLAANGNFYGATFSGGANGPYGTIYKMTPAGALTTIYSFCSQSGCPDGRGPDATLVQGSGGDLYGTTSFGGAAGDGTVFKITPTGALTTLYSFCAEAGCADGKTPKAGLVLGSDGNLYGTTTAGGNSGDGTVFKITSSGILTTLYSFCSQSGCSDGDLPYAGLMQSTNGEFYGTTYYGGSGGNFGAVFSLSLGLGPFVETQTTSGKVGAAVDILGTSLIGATSVTFNGVAAVFKVASSSEITTTVPTGATTGLVEVVTPGGTLISNVPFRVLQ
jgi:uncharacterized repeat protein (TIGR03803 family)